MRPKLRKIVALTPLMAIGFLGATKLSAEEPAAKLVEVRGTIVDSDGEPIPARLTIRSADGKYFLARTAGTAGPAAVTYDRRRSERVVEIHTALPAGDFVASLPPGKYELVAERGKEYFPRTVELTVDPDVSSAARIPLTRWIDMTARGWYSGDTHVHRSVDEIKVPVLAEDVNIAFPLTYWVTDAHASPIGAPKSVKESPGAAPIVVAPNHLISPLNTEYELFTYGGKRHTLGAFFAINHQQPLQPGTPPVGPIAEEIHRQGGLIDLDKHSWPWTPMIVPVMQADLFELANNHIWQTEFLFRDWTLETLPDDWEIELDDAGGWTEHGWIDFGFKTYYAFLNCGFPLRPTAGTAHGVHPVPLGFGRVYVQLDGEFTVKNWLAGLNAGRSFVTTGPMLMVEFNGQPAGRIEMPQQEDIPVCRVKGEAASARPLDRIEVIVNGDVAATIKPANERQANGSYRSPIDLQVKIERTSWIAVRCFEPRAGDGGRYLYAHTAPAHCTLGTEPLVPKRREVRYFLKRIDEELARNRGVLTAEDLGEFEQARAVYQALWERAE